MVATLKSNGAAFMKPISRFVRGQVKSLLSVQRNTFKFTKRASLTVDTIYFQVDGIAGSLESLKPTLATKCCFLCSLVYVILPIDLTYILMSGVLVAMKAGPLFGIPVDVLGPLENKFLPLIFGTVKKPEEKKE